MIEIVIPVYRELHRLSFVVEGLARQTVDSFVVHFINDGGNRSIANLLKKWIGGRFAWTYHYLEPMTPLFRKSAALNLGLMYVTSDRVLILDNDVVPTPGVVEAHMTTEQEWDVLVGSRRHVKPIWISRQKVANFSYKVLEEHVCK